MGAQARELRLRSIRLHLQFVFKAWQVLARKSETLVLTA